MTASITPLRPKTVDDTDPRQLAAEVEMYRRAMERIVAVCREAARGNLEMRLEDLGGDAQLVELRGGLNQLLDLTDAFVREAGASLQAAADGKFYRRVLTQGMRGCFGSASSTINKATHAMAEGARRLLEAEEQRVRLAGEFESEVASVTIELAQAAREMSGSSAELATRANDVADRAADAAESSGDASAATTSVASATEELSATVAEIERQLTASSSAVSAVVSEISRASEMMAGLGEASRQIDRVTTVITHVANQTRLLALNATIEAARAGTAGKGFAVVASEVKALAKQTAEASEQIASQIASVQSAVAAAIGTIGGISGSMREVDEIAQAIARSASDQREATRDINGNLQRTAAAARDVSDNVERVLDGTRITSDVAARLESSSKVLSDLGARLRARVDAFLVHIRRG